VSETAMKIDVVTLFPSLFDEPLRISLLGKAVADGLLEVSIHDLRMHGLGRHRVVDDEPYGGGAGMVMRPEPIADAVNSLRRPQSHIVLMSPRGTLLNHEGVRRLAEFEHLILICGRYEGVDERVAARVVDEELSVGDYVLSGGELGALVVIEAVSRLLPGVLGNEESLEMESHAQGLLEYPQYTRPPSWEGLGVPDVLLSGDHGAVRRWRQGRAEELTRIRRPDMWRRYRGD
jgi:tRNA (guanine37-N1)-methyltransferase